MSTDLVTRLRAALDAEEAAAHAAIDMDTRWRVGEGESKVHPVTHHSSWGYYIADAYYTAYAVHIAAHDPAFVLADIAAKRAILGLHQPAPGWDGESSDGTVCILCAEDTRDGERSGDPYPCTTIRVLAEAYRIIE